MYIWVCALRFSLVVFGCFVCLIVVGLQLVALGFWGVVSAVRVCVRFGGLGCLLVFVFGFMFAVFRGVFVCHCVVFSGGLRLVFGL